MKVSTDGQPCRRITRGENRRRAGGVQPFEVSGTPAPPAPPSLSPSPSRVADFMTCPLRQRFRAIDRLPERSSAAVARGVLVHAVLERLFDDPAVERTAARARCLVAGEGERLPAAVPGLAELFAEGGGAPVPERVARWLAGAERLVERRAVVHAGGPDPAGAGGAGTVRRGGAGLRADAARGHRPGGRGADRRGAAGRLQDGQGPWSEYAADALFRLKSYTLVLWRLRGAVPAAVGLSRWRGRAGLRAGGG